MYRNLEIVSPKRKRKAEGVESWYPYYAGFNGEFVHSILNALEVDPNACVVDPWNGSGTTTTVAYERGLISHGYDLNPVMVIAAKAGLIPVSEKPSLVPLAMEISKRAKETVIKESTSDPLNFWFTEYGSINFRRLEHSIQRILVDENVYKPLHESSSVEKLSSIASFFYVGLFKAIRQILNPFKTSNPTWIKLPKNANKLRPSLDTIISVFVGEVRAMVGSFPDKREGKTNLVNVGVASSYASPLTNAVADFVVTSPPYCTRIDYAVATMPELTLLGFDPKGSLQVLRKKMIGTSTVPDVLPNVNSNWGDVCTQLLRSIASHPSKASNTYYLKNHIQYFDSLYRSLSEVNRVLKASGTCVLVVQDSYYKDIHNDLARITTEMCSSLGLQLRRRDDFSEGRSMAGINPNVRKYRNSSKATESVLFYSKSPNPDVNRNYRSHPSD